MIELKDSWVSSGYWAVKKDYLTNAPMFGTVETTTAFSGGRDVRTIQDEHVGAVVPEGQLVECLRTVATLSLKAGDIAIFQAPDSYTSVEFGKVTYWVR